MPPLSIHPNYKAYPHKKKLHPPLRDSPAIVVYTALKRLQMDSHKKEYWDSIIARCLADSHDTDAWTQLREWLSESEANRQTFEAMQKIWTERSSDPRALNHNDVRDRIWRQATGSADTSPGTTRWDLLRWVAVIGGLLIVATTAYWVSGFYQKDPTYIVQHNEAGQRSQFILPDHSQVWLQAGSTLRYPEDFGPAERRVVLEGEAFFDVIKDPTKPFIVDTEDLSTTALGTSFNVAAYIGKPAIEVTLVTGRVKVWQHTQTAKATILEPGRGARYEKSTHHIASFPAAVDVIRAWTDGILVFAGDDYPEFVRKIEQWYGISVTSQGTVPLRWSIRGKFDHPYLSDVLDVLSFNKGFTYTLNEKQLTIIFPT